MDVEFTRLVTLVVAVAIQLSWVAMSVPAAAVGRRNGHDGRVCGAVGLLLGPLGLLVVALWPAGPRRIRVGAVAQLDRPVALDEGGALPTGSPLRADQTGQASPAPR